MRKEVNGPAEKKLQQGVLYRLKKSLLAAHSGATPSLSSLGAAMHGEGAGSSSSSGTAFEVDPTAIVLDDPLETGMREAEAHPEKPFSFAARTWALEMPPPGEEETDFSGLPQPQARPAPIINPRDVADETEMGELDLDAMMEAMSDDEEKEPNPRHKRMKNTPRTEKSRNGLSGFNKKSGRARQARPNYKRDGERHTNTKKRGKGSKGAAKANIARAKSRASKNRALGSMG